MFMQYEFLFLRCKIITCTRLGIPTCAFLFSHAEISEGKHLSKTEDHNVIILNLKMFSCNCTREGGRKFILKSKYCSYFRVSGQN